MKIPSPMHLLIMLDKRFYMPVPEPLEYPRDVHHLRTLKAMQKKLSQFIYVACVYTFLPTALMLAFDYRPAPVITLFLAVVLAFQGWALVKRARLIKYFCWLTIALRLARTTETDYVKPER